MINWKNWVWLWTSTVIAELGCIDHVSGKCALQNSVKVSYVYLMKLPLFWKANPLENEKMCITEQENINLVNIDDLVNSFPHSSYCHVFNMFTYLQQVIWEFFYNWILSSSSHHNLNFKYEVVSLLPDDQWYRGVCIGSDVETAAVFFVDYGNHENVPHNRLCQIPESFLELPCIALHCILKGTNFALYMSFFSKSQF